MRHLPIFLDLTGRACLVVGGGQVAARKVELLLRAGARVTVAAPALNLALDEQVSRGVIAYHAGVFTPELLASQTLVIAASDDRNVNRWVSEHAQRRQIPVNVVDDPALCSFIMPAIVDRSPVVIAISSGGAAPVLARLLRARLEALIAPGYGRLAALAGAWRARAQQRLPDLRARRYFWERALTGAIAECALNGDDAQAQALLHQALLDAAHQQPPVGAVHLLHVASSEPDLLTLRALRLLQHADKVFYQPTVAPPILDLARRDASRCVLERQHYPDVLREHARQGLQVCLLYTERALVCAHARYEPVVTR